MKSERQEGRVYGRVWRKREGKNYVIKLRKNKCNNCNKSVIKLKQLQSPMPVAGRGKAEGRSSTQDKPPSKLRSSQSWLRPCSLCQGRSAVVSKRDATV